MNCRTSRNVRMTYIVTRSILHHVSHISAFRISITNTYAVRTCRHSRRWQSFSTFGLHSTPLLEKGKDLPFAWSKCCFHFAHSPTERIQLNINNGDSPVTNKDMLQMMVSYIWPKDNSAIKRRVLLSFSLLITAKVANVSIPVVFKCIIDELNNQGSAGQILSMLTPQGTIITTAFALIAGYGLARLVSSGFNELRNAVFANVAQHSIRRIARNVFIHLHMLDLNFHLSRQTGALTKIIDRGSRGINFVLSALVFNVIPTIFELGLVSILLGMKFGLSFSALSVGCVFIYSVFTFTVTQWRTKFRIFMNQAENEAGNRAVDSLINYETVKYFNNEEHEADRYDAALKKYEDASLKTSTSLSLLNFGQSAIFTGALTLAMVMAANEIAAGNMTVGDLVMINGLLFQLSMPLGFLGSVYREVRQALTDMQMMFTLMVKDPAIKDKQNVESLKLTPQNASIEFRDVYFQYVKGKPVFKGLSFTIPAGRKIAIVGSSGTGKSSLIRLLFRFMEPDTGNIIIGGKSVRDMSLECLRRSVAVVPQDAVLFNDTIFYNLHYGDLKKSTEEVYKAAEMANIHSTIQRWPKGYDTQVGERGLRLSGGEKQRVAIARAVLKDAPVLVFDEATSSLDSITEHNIMNALEKAMEGKTSICIAHRLSTVMNADQILVLHDGKIVESGTHAQLISDINSLYRKMWSMQHSRM